ncbi:MAG: hypothetical protein V3S54_01750, partial [Woeseiaceae bacterium]
KKKHGISRYFNDLAATPDELHGQALTTLKNRLCSSYPAMTFVAIARCLAKAFFLFKMMARGGPIRGANQDSEAARRMRIGSSRSKSINHRHADFQFGSGSPLAIFFNKLPGHQSVTQMASLSGDFGHQMGQLRPKSCLFRDKRYSEQRLR